MRTSGQMLARVLAMLRGHVTPGISTYALARVAEEELKRLGGKPVFRGYQGFPDVICISVNDEVVHGIPSEETILESGDIVGLDFGVNFEGMITDGAISVPVGEVSSEAKRLLAATEQALAIGIEQVKAGKRTGDIGAAVESRLLRDRLGVVEDLAGHGVGRELHEDPSVPNFGRAGSGDMLKAGMTIAIEPMATLGSKDVVLLADGWTIATEDGTLAAHFEHTVLVTRQGAEILTLP
jgi:methionyl aminopeptidase